MNDKHTQPSEDRDKPDTEPDGKEAPETPPTEPQPAPIQDPEQPNETVPYVV
jgi:hypothetical protein